MSIHIKFLGHSSILIVARIANKQTKIIIDPFITNNPQCNFSLDEFSDIDHIILTHGHDDHASDVVELAKLGRPCISATYELCALINNEVEAVYNYMNKGGEVTIDDLSIKLVHAIHSNSYKGQYAGEACGVVLCLNGIKIYHAGDTALIEDPVGEEIDVAFIPIGDRFTMGISDAVKFCKRIRAKKIIPIHYNTFSLIEQDADEFVRICREASIDSDIIILNSGQELHLQ